MNPTCGRLRFLTPCLDDSHDAVGLRMGSVDERLEVGTEFRRHVGIVYLHHVESDGEGCSVKRRPSAQHANSQVSSHIGIDMLHCHGAKLDDSSGNRAFHA